MSGLWDRLLQFNAGHIFSDVRNALVKGDFVLAGFKLVDTLRTEHLGNPGLKARTRAEYLNLLADHYRNLGNVI